MQINRNVFVDCILKAYRLIFRGRFISFGSWSAPSASLIIGISSSFSMSTPWSVSNTQLSFFNRLSGSAKKEKETNGEPWNNRYIEYKHKNDKSFF